MQYIYSVHGLYTHVLCMTIHYFLLMQERLSKRRELLTEKMKAEQKEQEQIRNEEQKVLK